MSTRDLLIEIGTEELPPKALTTLCRAFMDGIRQGLKSAELDHGALKAYATPRRLALMISALQEKQTDKQVQRRGPALTAAFDDEGCPTKAAEGFAKSCGVSVDALDKLETDKGSWLAFTEHQAGEATTALIPDIVRRALDGLPIPKRMRWGDLKEQFVRPVHWAILLYGEEVIDTTILGVSTGRETRGHRFHHPDTIYIGEPAAYAPLLESEGHVIADFDVRREAIRGQILEAAKQVKGKAVIDDDLLNEVTSMVEWPHAILGNFDQRFLDVPSEALISAMKGHQKYFHLVDKHSSLMPHFITISNIDSRDPNKVREGNERVIRPRLTDAEFFWDQDRKTRLADRVESLKSVVFQNKLGSLHSKVLRIIHLAASIANDCGKDPSHAKRAAELCKCDLMTEMVGEFPELQGIMGRYYAQMDGEPIEVASAIDEHYMPRFSGDDLPETDAGIFVSLADKLDTLVGIFGIGQSPSGDKDPFALRRAALGILRILIIKHLDLDLMQLIKYALKNYTYQKLPLSAVKTTDEVYDFILARLQVYYTNIGFTFDEIDAVLCMRPTILSDCNERLEALAEFRTLPESDSLAAANKRISNILKKIDDAIPLTWNNFLLEDPEEKALAGLIEQLIPEIDPLIENNDYSQALKKLAALRDPVDAFFDKVMVMTDDDVLRKNRLSILNALRHQFMRIADLSKLQ